MSASSEASKKKKKFPKQSPAVMNTQAINLVSDDVDYDGDDDMGEKNELHSVRNSDQHLVLPSNPEARNKKSDHSKDRKRRKLEKKSSKDDHREKKSAETPEKEQNRSKSKSASKDPVSLVNSKNGNSSKKVDSQDKELNNSHGKEENGKKETVFLFEKPVVKIPTFRIPRLTTVSQSSTGLPSAGLPSLLVQNLEQNLSKSSAINSNAALPTATSQLNLQTLMNKAVAPCSSGSITTAHNNDNSNAVNNSSDIACRYSIPQFNASTAANEFGVPKPISTLPSAVAIQKSLNQNLPSPSVNDRIVAFTRPKVANSFSNYNSYPSTSTTNSSITRVQVFEPEARIRTESSQTFGRNPRDPRLSSQSSSFPKPIINWLGLRKQSVKSVKFSSEDHVRLISPNKDPPSIIDIPQNSPPT